MKTIIILACLVAVCTGAFWRGPSWYYARPLMSTGVGMSGIYTGGAGLSYTGGGIGFGNYNYWRRPCFGKYCRFFYRGYNSGPFYVGGGAFAGAAAGAGAGMSGAFAGAGASAGFAGPFAGAGAGAGVGMSGIYTGGAGMNYIGSGIGFGKYNYWRRPCFGKYCRSFYRGYNSGPFYVGGGAFAGAAAGAGAGMSGAFAGAGASAGLGGSFASAAAAAGAGAGAGLSGAFAGAGASAGMSVGPVFNGGGSSYVGGLTGNFGRLCKGKYCYYG